MLRGSSGIEFKVKGISYQPRSRVQPTSSGGAGSKSVAPDPISNEKEHEWSVALECASELHLNTIRVYEVDPSQPHDRFMAAIAQKQMYLLLDLGSGQDQKRHIDRSNPTYDVETFEGFRAVVDVFAGYDNVLGFFAGNEVANDVETTKSANFVKALIRDLKTYTRNNSITEHPSNSPRKFDRTPVPIGYSSNDDAKIRVDLFRYFSCERDRRDDRDDIADFYGINIYSWCGDHSSYEISGYADRTAEYSKSPIPVIISEYGCNVVRPRKFQEVAAIYGPNMSTVFAGAVMYELTEEQNEYGIVEWHQNNTIERLPEFDYFKKAIMAAQPKLRDLSTYSFEGETSTCPSQSPTWLASYQLPPPADECICARIAASFNCRYDSHDSTTANVSTSLQDLYSVACGLLSLKQPSACNQPPPEIALCPLVDKLSWIYNTYFESGYGKCDFGGNARRGPGDLDERGRRCGVLESGAKPKRVRGAPPIQNGNEKGEEKGKDGLRTSWTVAMQIDSLMYSVPFLFSLYALML
ncbi:Glucanosyltransferase-domain-containing protein [Cladochytrium replicatum]|nr:Glucanosyltransferase-domain-containing protein [Cladochytrium replicatum]